MKLKIGIRLWILIIALILAVLAISPSFKTGVVVKSVDRNSSAYEAGLRAGTVIKEINSLTINSMEDYADAMSKIFKNGSIQNKVVIKDDKKKEIIFFSDSVPEINVENIPRTRLKLGLDLSGGARALVKPVNVTLSGSEISDLVAVTRERFNVYGLSDIVVRAVKDLEGNNYMMVEIAGASPSDLEELVGKQGKFEAKIGNETVFIGGKRDISSVCRTDATCSRIETCGRSENGYACRFTFVIYLSEEAAKLHADITDKLGINSTTTGKYLDQKLDLYVDDNLVESLLIGEELKGKITTQIAVSGSGSGVTQQDAYNNAKENMHKLQTILITGSMPYKLEIAKLDTISPVLGQKFIFYVLLAGAASIVAVSLIVFMRYRNVKSSLAVLLTSFSEVVLILGFAALIKWNLDLVSIAGILTVIGTGVDQQIVILDESRTKKDESAIEKIKRAFFIVIGSYFTVLASLVPLYWAGAGLLRGFALTTIIGITTGLLITRPAFMEIMKRLKH